MVNREEDDAVTGERRMSFWEHLGELRWVIIRSLFAFVPALALVVYFGRWLFERLLEPLQRLQGDVPLYTFSPPEAVLLYIKITLVGAVLISSPYWLAELIHFVGPGLKSGERKLIYPVGIVGIGLFLAGVAFSYFLVVPFSLHYLWEFNQVLGVQPHWRIDYYVNFVLMMMIAFGISFELPLVVTVLARIGIASPAYLAHLRPYAIVGLVGMSALITPPDVITQLMMAGPLWILYEISVLMARLVYGGHPVDEPEEEQNEVS